MLILVLLFQQKKYRIQTKQKQTIPTKQITLKTIDMIENAKEQNIGQLLN